MIKNTEQSHIVGFRQIKGIFLLLSVNGLPRKLRVCLYCGAESKYRKEEIPLTEEQKIKQIFDQYSSYFEDSNVDVGHTKKGVWFFYEYDEEHDYYNSFIRFKTAKELEWLIAELAADDLNVLIEAGAEDMQYALKEIDINNATACSYDRCILELLKNMEVLNSESQKWAERVDVICRSLSGIMERLQDKN